MVRIQKWLFFFGPKNPHFGPKIRFFVWDPVFWQSGARNPRRWFRFGTFGSSVRLFVSELRPFSRGEPGRRAKKSYPTPLWGHRLPVKALALSALSLRASPGLDKTCLWISQNLDCTDLVPFRCATRNTTQWMRQTISPSALTWWDYQQQTFLNLGWCCLSV